MKTCLPWISRPFVRVRHPRFALGRESSPRQQTAKCHVTTALWWRWQFADHAWTAGSSSSGKWLTARFFATKNYTASRLKARNSFLYVYVGFLNSNQWFIPVFWAIKVMHFDLMKKNMAALNNKIMNVLLQFEIFATWNFKRVTVNSSSRFSMKNLMLKVSNNDMRTVLLLNLVRLELRSASEPINNLGWP